MHQAVSNARDVARHNKSVLPSKSKLLRPEYPNTLVSANSLKTVQLSQEMMVRYNGCSMNRLEAGCKLMVPTTVARGEGFCSQRSRYIAPSILLWRCQKSVCVVFTRYLTLI
jgi:hypothetical protein